LIVDELKGEFQTVIKPLGKIFRNLKGISGATILGDGRVSAILDIPVLLEEQIKNTNKRR
jgi:two-component system chemotaxis sensor kinase CheA